MLIDLRTVVVPRERKIWVVHPGKNKKFFEDFERNSRIYLEYPGLELNPGVLEDDVEIRRRIKHSIETMQYDGLVRPDGTPILRADFDGESRTNVAVYLRTVKHLFVNMQPGDLVVVPGWGAYARVLFGEVLGPVNFGDRARIYPHVFADTQFRPVRWLSTDRKKPDLGDLVKFVNKPPAIAEVGRDPATERFFDFAYEAYVMEGRSWSTITAPNYRSNDPGAIADSLKLIEFAVATFRAIEAEESIAGLSVEQIIEQFYHTGDIEYFGLSYASPGRLDFRSRNTRLSLWVAAVVALATAGALAGCEGGADLISVENSTTQSAQLNSEMEGQIGVLVDQVDQPTAVQVDRMGQRASQTTGLASPVEVRE